jgi:6-pyruvoyltetrahydropterin/6-carboxytetrahydropterin synthase
LCLVAESQKEQPSHPNLRATMNEPLNVATLLTSAASLRSEIYRSTKTYDHIEGLSCCFRQWRATHSHCSRIHGYALAFRFVFATNELDACNWCFDFGGLTPVKEWLKGMFDHTMLAAEDDPELLRFQELARDGLVDLRILPAVGCEAIAKCAFDYVAGFVDQKTGGRVWLESAEVREHVGNSAIYSGPMPRGAGCCPERKL